MWLKQESALRAAKKSSSVKDQGSFILVYYPEQGDYTYFLDEERARRDGRPAPYQIVGRYRWQGLLKGFRKEELAEDKTS